MMTLGSGERAQVLMNKSEVITYTKSLRSVGAAGASVSPEIATIEAGIKVVRTAGGACVHVLTELVAMESVSTSLGIIQAPLVKVTEAPGWCPSQIGSSASDAASGAGRRLR